MKRKSKPLECIVEYVEDTPNEQFKGYEASNCTAGAFCIQYADETFMIPWHRIQSVRERPYENPFDPRCGNA